MAACSLYRFARMEIVQHVLYEDSIHGELPRARVRDMVNLFGVEHIELNPVMRSAGIRRSGTTVL